MLNHVVVRPPKVHLLNPRENIPPILGAGREGRVQGSRWGERGGGGGGDKRAL